MGAKGFWKEGQGFQEWSDGTDFRPTTSTATVAWAAGAMEGSVRDLLDWEMALYEGDVLTPEALAQMLDFDQRSPATAWAPGPRPWPGDRATATAGSLRGFVSVMYRLPVEDLDVVVLANVGFANLDRVADRLAKAALNALATPEPSARRAPVDGRAGAPGEGAALTGRYRPMTRQAVRGKVTALRHDPYRRPNRRPPRRPPGGLVS